MAFGSKDKEKEFLYKQIETLQEEKKDLFKRIDKLQEALIASKSPDAYREMKYDERAMNISEPSEEAKKEHQLRRETVNNYLNSLENPTFKNADDMINILASGGLDQDYPPAQPSTPEES